MSIKSKFVLVVIALFAVVLSCNAQYRDWHQGACDNALSGQFEMSYGKSKFTGTTIDIGGGVWGVTMPFSATIGLQLSAIDDSIHLKSFPDKNYSYWDIYLRVGVHQSFYIGDVKFYGELAYKAPLTNSGVASAGLYVKVFQNFMIGIEPTYYTGYNSSGGNIRLLFAK